MKCGSTVLRTARRAPSGFAMEIVVELAFEGLRVVARLIRAALELLIECLRIIGRPFLHLFLEIRPRGRRAVRPGMAATSPPGRARHRPAAAFHPARHSPGHGADRRHVSRDRRGRSGDLLTRFIHGIGPRVPRTGSARRGRDWRNRSPRCPRSCRLPDHSRGRRSARK